MAKKTIQIPLEDKFGYVDAQYPNAVYQVTADGEYKVTRGGYRGSYLRYFFCRISDVFPDALKYQRLYDLKAVFQVYFKEEDPSAIKDLGGLFAYTCGDFDPRTLTYNTMPANGIDSTVWSDLVGDYTAGRWANIESNGTYGKTSGLEKLKSSRTKDILKKKNLRLETLDGTYTSLDVTYNKSRDYPEGTCYASVKSRLVGGELPYVIVEYDDEETVTGKVVFTKNPTGEIDQGIDTTVKWEIQAKSYAETDWFCLTDVWEQSSATFYWREQGALSWNEINIQDDTSQIVIPARTFGSDKTYEYYLRATDVAGGESETATFTFTTPGSQLTPQNSPTSGYADPRNPITFGWSYRTGSGTVAGGATTLHWREAGTQAWTDVAAAADVYSLTIPANTFSPLKVYEWYLSGTDTYGYASSTSTYTFNTSAAQIASIPLSPINSIEDKNEIITFQWEFASDDGAPASRCILQYRATSETNWTELADITSPTAGVNSYDVPALTFDAGAMEWQVIPYNIDEVLGTYSPVTFIAYGAPVRPTVFTDSVPFLTVRWQAEEQESYQIMVDDESFGPYFGGDKVFQLPDKLEDGEYTVKVRTMGVYGLWSQWGETTTVIENDPGEDITLTANPGTDVSLSWATEEETADFRIYRDGEQIGKTTGTEFRDRTVLGEHTYVVVNKLADGNYSVSNEVMQTAVVSVPNIAVLDGGEWLPIMYSIDGQMDPEYNDNTETIYNHLAGSIYPSAALSGYRDTSMTFSALFVREQEAERRMFESMFGQTVILKMRDGTIFVGVLDNWRKQHRKAEWTGYSFTIRRVDWEDYFDGTA